MNRGPWWVLSIAHMMCFLMALCLQSEKSVFLHKKIRGELLYMTGSTDSEGWCLLGL